MCHYLLCTSAWVRGYKAETCERRDRGAGAASINTHHANSTVIYGESHPSGGQMTLTHGYQRKISVDSDSRIVPLSLQDTLLGWLCVCAQVCTCV